MQSFRCPRCHGGYFGAIIDQTMPRLIIGGYECHNTVSLDGRLVYPSGTPDGNDVDPTLPPISDRPVRYRAEGRPCGWRGPAFDCGMED